jgi:hypothetical protein
MAAVEEAGLMEEEVVVTVVVVVVVQVRMCEIREQERGN